MKQALADALQKRGYDTLTPVQMAVTAPELAQADLLVSAQTGSGKTVGFGLAIGDSLLGGNEVFDRAANPLALIIAPTRELALQVKRELHWLYGEAQVTIVYVPQVMAEIVEVVRLIPQERVHQRTVEQIVVVPVLQVVKEMIEVDQIIPRVYHRLKRRCASDDTETSTNNQDGSEDSGGSSTSAVLD